MHSKFIYALLKLLGKNKHDFGPLFLVEINKSVQTETDPHRTEKWCNRNNRFIPFVMRLRFDI
ncbi:hypothetical protein RchiOBHm_Chr6g0271281 [Rosa chinensis]|uniref:Uncharacterized protein n=1 Tax=Rosa chinensis TaxID=74649 RepID=A0A2P6PQY2_ROSCH|nr:hypothetical protein RchiOBHm_Chr6g0271281 [Rosa chinensis]